MEMNDEADYGMRVPMHSRGSGEASAAFYLTRGLGRAMCQGKHLGKFRGRIPGTCIP
jgi:hypothetical protein